MYDKELIQKENEAFSQGNQSICVIAEQPSYYVTEPLEVLNHVLPNLVYNGMNQIAKNLSFSFS